jgi:hypothetical protein
VLIEPPFNLIRQMPPSSAWTIRSNPGQAEGRKAVDIGRSFKGGDRLAVLWWAKGRHYACFARAHENACRSESAMATHHAAWRCSAFVLFELERDLAKGLLNARSMGLHCPALDHQFLARISSCDIG